MTGQEFLDELKRMTKKELSKKIVILDEPCFGEDEYIEVETFEIRDTENDTYIVLI